mmetsp:Transcript_20259/g.44095  ORF Transcript_20259/g.44095 Transcript_20259/m.44095 type:complete len:376 (-) Transcript_20259:782-1909(-)
MGFPILLVTVLLCFMQPIEIHGFVSNSRTFILTDTSGPSCSSSAGNSQSDILTPKWNQPLLGPSLWTVTGTASSTCLSSSSSPSSATSDIRRVVDWIMDKPLESLISKEETIAISREWTGDEVLIDGLEQTVIENWDKIVQKLTKSSEGNRRTLSGLLGEEATQRLLRGVQNLDIYSDSKTVNAFLQSDAVNDLFAQTLYDGIYEFFQTIDVFGNIISGLPVLGPIRNKIRDDLKKQLDRTLGPTLRTFLKGYTSIAIGRASSFILSDQNRRAFGAANSRLLKSVLDRPVQDLLRQSSDPSIAKLRTEFFGYLRQLNEEDSSDLENYADFVYDLIGDKSLDSVGLNVRRVLDASPTLESTANRIFDEAINNNQPE